MRHAAARLVSVLVGVAACSQQAVSALPDAGETPSEDGSPAACTSIGGMCVDYTQACPVPQQNTTLCGVTVKICCLPPGGPVLPGADGGAVTASGAVDGSTEAQAPAEAGDDATSD